MSARSKARKRALDMLFAAEARVATNDVAGLADSIRTVLSEESSRALREPTREQSWRYANAVVTGVSEHLEEIDGTIRAAALEWPLERMPAVDRALLRIAVWEMSYNPAVPAVVAVAEAVRLAGEMSTEKSASFLNGVLAAVAVRLQDDSGTQHSEKPSAL